jgi:hypothetical protein
MKKIVYQCDVCRTEVAKSDSNVTANMGNSNAKRSGEKYDAIVCDQCAANTPVDEIIKAVISSAQKQTGLTMIASVEFLKLDAEGTMIGSKTALSKPTPIAVPPMPEVEIQIG